MIFTKKSITPNKQQGFSLIELLVSMLIGLFLLTGMATSFLSSKKASIDRDQLSILEDNGRLALEVIGKTVEHAGYTPIINVTALPHSIISNTTEIVQGKCSDDTDSIIEPTLFNDTRVTLDNADGDSLAVAYYGDSNLFNDAAGGTLIDECKVPAAGTVSSIKSEASVIYSSFFLNNGKLKCAGSRSDSLQVIADNIENIQFLYGIKSGNSNAVDRYLNASDMTGLWDSVISIQVAILVRSSSPVKAVEEQKTFSLLDQIYHAHNDKYQRAVFTSTIRLRNTL